MITSSGKVTNYILLWVMVQGKLHEFGHTKCSDIIIGMQFENKWQCIITLVDWAEKIIYKSPHSTDIPIHSTSIPIQPLYEESK